MSGRTETPKPRGPIMAVIYGTWRLTRGDPRGLSLFGGDVDAFGAAFAPWLAVFFVVGSVFALSDGASVGFTAILLNFTCILAQLVIAHAFATHWARERLWMRYAVAAMWTMWLPFLLQVFVTPLLHFTLPSSIIDTRGGAIGTNLVFFVYELWLTWFVARVALALSRGRAVLLVSAIYGAGIVMDVTAALLPPYYNFWTDFSTPLFGN